MDPCGTPDMGKPREEWTPDILVTCDRLEMSETKKDRSHKV